MGEGSGRPAATYDIYEAAIIKGRIKYAYQNLLDRLEGAWKKEKDVVEMIAELCDGIPSASTMEDQYQVSGDTPLQIYAINQMASASEFARKRFQEMKFSSEDKRELARMLVEGNFLNIDLNKLYRVTEEDFRIAKQGEQGFDVQLYDEIFADRKNIEGIFAVSKVLGKKVPHEVWSARATRREKLFKYHSQAKVSSDRFDLKEGQKQIFACATDEEFSPELFVHGVRSLSLMMHCGPYFVDPAREKEKLLTLLKEGVSVRVLINNNETLKKLIPHVDGPQAFYSSTQKIQKAWKTMVEENKTARQEDENKPACLEVRECTVPIFHRAYLAQYEEKLVVSCRYYTFANDQNLKNPVMNYSSSTDKEMTALYQKEFEYLWQLATPICSK